MNNTDIIKNCERTYSLLSNCRVQEAINMLKRMAANAGNYNVSDRLDTIDNTYRSLLRYMAQGLEDPQRNNVLADIKDKLLTISDILVRDCKTDDSSDAYYETLRVVRLGKKNTEDLLRQYISKYSEFKLADSVDDKNATAIHRELEYIQTDLFNIVWTSFDERDVTDLVLMIADNIDKYGKQLLIHLLSAMTLSLVAYYDRYKLLALIDIYDKYEDDNDAAIAANALLGIIIALQQHGLRIEDDAKLMARLDMWNDSIVTYQRLRDSVRIIAGTRDTQRIADKMQKEIIPELMKLRPEIVRKIGELGTNADIPELGDNPEWAEKIEQSGVGKKLRELNEMQQEGADLMMVAFANLKRFPFFNAAANWFLPFYPDHSDIQDESLHDILHSGILFENIAMCSSDKYSFALALKQMPTAQRQMMQGQMEAQLAHITDDIKDRMLKSNGVNFENEMLHAVRNMYRFMLCFRKKEGFVNPFATPLNFLKLPKIGEMMSDNDVVNLLGEFYFSRGYYNEALPLLELLARDDNNAAIYEKIGFCYQKIGFMQQALEYYTRAELLGTPGMWLLKKLAYVNKVLGNYPASMQYYETILDKEPENMSAILSAGYCALEAGEYDRALQHYYHAYYDHPDNADVRRAIAWAELKRGNTAKSRELYEKMEPESMTAADYMNAAHAALIDKDMTKAIELYRRSKLADPETFRADFEADINSLVQLGADELQLRLLLDYLLN